MDKLDALIHWATDLDRSTQFEVLNRLLAISPVGIVMAPGTVNDPAKSPVFEALDTLIPFANTPFRREGLWLMLVGWLDVVMQDDGMTWHEQMVGTPIRTASGSARPVTDEIKAEVMAFQLMDAARTSSRWSDAVQSWKEFRRGPA